MEKSEAQGKVTQSEVKSPPTTSTVPHLWNNLLQWCNSDMQNQIRKVSARPHECKTCGKRFTLLENLNRHQMIHTNQRPFHCPYCSKSFRLSQHLKEHIRIHTGEKPYKCHICGHAFCQISNLKSHQKTHTKVKGFRCDQCGKEFRRSFTLKQHKLTHNKSGKSKGATAPKTLETHKTGNENAARTDVVTVITTTNAKSNAVAQNGDVAKENAQSISKISPASTSSMYQNLISKSSDRLSSTLPHDGQKGTHLISWWNAFNQRQKTDNEAKGNVAPPKIPDNFGLSNAVVPVTATNTYSHISRFLALANSKTLNNFQPHEAKSDLKPLLPMSPTDPWFRSKVSNQIPVDMSLNGASKDSGKTSVTLPATVALNVPCQNDAIFSPHRLTEEKTSYENSTKKRRQAQSLYEPIVSCSSLFDGFSTKNNHLFPRTRQFKSLTLSQDYNWKRQLCREWQQTDRQTWLHGKMQGRSNSAELPRLDSLSSAFGENKSMLTSDLIKSETKVITPRPSLSFDDDVFSPLSTRSTATPRDGVKNNSLPLSNDARSASFLQGQREIFQYPDVPSAKRVCKFNKSLSDQSSVTKTSPNSIPRSDLGAMEKSPLTFASNAVPPLFFPTNTQKTISPAFPATNPVFDFNSGSSLTDPLLNSKLPVSPDFKAFANSLSFVPLVTWKPVVTGWRNMLDGNVYPARMGVDNLNSFTLQQQIS